MLIELDLLRKHIVVFYNFEIQIMIGKCVRMVKDSYHYFFHI